MTDAESECDLGFPFQGAAIEDGNLRIGDRLLEVNGVEVTGRSQSEVAALLREIPIGGAATLAVSRQDQRNGEAASGTADSTPETEKPASPKLPRQLVSGLGSGRRGAGLPCARFCFLAFVMLL